MATHDDDIPDCENEQMLCIEERNTDISNEDCFLNLKSEAAVDKCYSDIDNADLGNGFLKLKHETSVDKCYSELDRGWSWIILFASFSTFCVIGCSIFAIGITHVVLLEKFNGSVAMTSWASALHSVLSTLAAPVSSAMIDRFSCRVTIVAAGVCYVVGFLLTAFAPSLEVAIFTCGILAGMGGALAYTASMVVVQFNFYRHRNVSVGVANAGIGIGLLAFAPIMQLAYDYYGTTGYFIIMAAITANVVTFGMLCFPSNLEITIQRNRKYKANRKVQTTCSNLISYKKALLNKGMVTLCFAMGAYDVTQYVVFLYQPSYAVAKGVSPMDASYLISLSGILTVIGRIVTGMVANFKRVNSIFLYSGSIFVVAIATMVYPLISHHTTGHIVFVVFFGLFNGSCYVVISNVSLKFVQLEYLTSAIGLQFCFGGIGGLLGPTVAGVLLDSLGTYDIPLVVAGACSLVAGSLGILSSCCVRKDIKDIVIEIDCTENCKDSDS